VKTLNRFIVTALLTLFATQTLALDFTQATFHPLGDFLNPALALLTRFKEITNWAKIGFC
jgi:hypothetical protein